jgi:crotonobetainyl-CoA:carnitine CoA-transferase CaiB-like acyl-CoA transferase
MEQPLEGITVVDATHVMAGPFCTYLLRLLGARVIKIEKPLDGDVMREYGRDPAFEKMAPPFMAFNAGKESVTVDLKHPSGSEIVRQLVDKADVFVENFRPGVMARLGLGYDALHARNDRLVYCSLSGFGQSGPMRDYPAYDHIVQGVCGVMSLTGEPGSQPTKVGFPVIDTFTGYSAAFAIVAAIQQRGRTGKGQQVDVAMLDCALVLMSSMVAPYLTTGVAPEKVGNMGFNGSPTSSTFYTKDRPITLGANTQRQYETMCKLIGRENLIDDQRFLTPAMREQRGEELRAQIQPALLERSATEWEHKLNDAGVPAGVVRTIPEIVSEPHVQGRNLVLPLPPAPNGAKGFALNIGFKLEHGETGHIGAAPSLGEHTRTVLQELGYTAQSIDQLAQAKVV